MRQVCQVARINLFVLLCCSHGKFVYNSRMSTNGPNDETPRTTYPIPAELLEDAFEGDDESERDNEARLSHEWQEEQNSARHEDLYGCDDEGSDCPEWDD